MNEQQYVVLSLELHMFFARIMKEHAIFMEAGFTPANAEFAKTADKYKKEFENILLIAFHIGNGLISSSAANSGEIVTDYTLGSEQKTQNFTGIIINQDITNQQSRLYGSSNPRITPALVQQVRQLNIKVAPLLEKLIDFKSEVLNNVLSCHMFTANYPANIEHILREAKLYQSHLMVIERGQNPNDNPKETELFWDEIMKEHAQFIRGMLDPSEDNLIKTANTFVNKYETIIQELKTVAGMLINNITEKTLEETLRFRDFKRSGTKGINECKIRSIILPLLADHVLREANHYIRLLKQLKD